MIGKYLYILPFNGKPHMKIGISQSDFKRVRNHSTTYGIDLDGSYIVTAEKQSVISAIEREILCSYDAVGGYDGLDGGTEIRHTDHLGEILESIGSKHPRLGLKISKYSDFNHFVEHTSKERKHKEPGIDDNSTGFDVETFTRSCDKFDEMISKIEDHVMQAYYLDSFINHYTLVFKFNEFGSVIDRSKLFSDYHIEVNFKDKKSEWYDRYGISSMTGYKDVNELHVMFNFDTDRNPDLKSIPAEYLDMIVDRKNMLDVIVKRFSRIEVNTHCISYLQNLSLRK